MTKTASARSAPTAPATSAPEDGRLKLQAFAAPSAMLVAARRANWELSRLSAPGFELASARG